MDKQHHNMTGIRLRRPLTPAGDPDRACVGCELVELAIQQQERQRAMEAMRTASLKGL